MVSKSRNCFSAIVAVFAVLIVSCKTQTDYRLNTDVVKYFSDSFDIPRMIGSDFKEIHTRIRGGKGLIMALHGSDSSYFLIADIKGKKIDYKIKNIISDYSSTIWDVNSDMLVAAPAVWPYDLYIEKLSTGVSIKEKFGKGIPPSFTDIVINNTQLFYLSGVRGIAFINLESKTIRELKNPGIITTDYESNITSYPIDSSLNLLAGQSGQDYSSNIYAIDGHDSIRWNLSFKQKNGEPIALLSFSNFFAVKYDSTLVALDKRNGKRIWAKMFKDQITHAYKWNDKIFIYSLIYESGSYPVSDDTKYRLVIKLIDTKVGDEIWTRQLNCSGKPAIGICGNSLFLSDNRSFSVFSFETGDVKEKKNLPKMNAKNYAFEMLTDIKTGDYYIASYDGKIYW